MLSGALIRTPEDLETDRLGRAMWERRQNDMALRSLIQLDGRSIAVDGNTTAQSGLAIHQEIGMEPTAILEDGRYRILHHDVVKTNWAYIYVVRGYVVVDKLQNRWFVQQIINKGLGLPLGCHSVHLDTTRMVRTHGNQWTRGFCERQGRVDRGTVFGEGVEQDSVFGPELDRSSKRSVGWITNFFGSPTKVKVSPSGSVTVWANPPEGLFLNFLRREILPYVIALPLA